MHDVQRGSVLVGEGVGVVEALGDAGADLRRHRKGEGKAGDGGSVVEAAEVRTPHQLHGEVEGAVHLAEVEDGHDVGMGEACGEASFVEEHRLKARIVGEVGQDALDHEAAREAARSLLPREEDLGHAAKGDAPFEDVAPEGLPFHRFALRRRHRPWPPTRG